MSISRRNVMKMGAALAAVPLLGGFDALPANKKLFSTGLPDLDRALGGGMQPGSFLVVVGPRASGKTAFLLNLAKANGVVDAHNMNKGGSDMLSIVERTDGRHIGSLMLNAAEPSTDKELDDMEQNPAARSAFLTRWFERTREVVRHSGGLFVISARGTSDAASRSAWVNIPDYIICANQPTYSLVHSSGK